MRTPDARTNMKIYKIRYLIVPESEEALKSKRVGVCERDQPEETALHSKAENNLITKKKY